MTQQKQQNEPSKAAMENWKKAHVVRMPLTDPELDEKTKKLVHDFSKALGEKLLKAQEKYGYSNEWEKTDWQRACIREFAGHIEKGDPLDVAAYCAFMWFHGWATNAAMQPEREAAEKMAEFIRKRTKHEVHMNADCPCSSCEGQRLVAAYEAAKGK